MELPYAELGMLKLALGGQLLELSAREFILLTYLAQRAEQLISPQELIRVTHDLETWLK